MNINPVDQTGEVIKKVESQKIKVFDLDELFAKDFPPVAWIVDKLIPRQGLVALSGIPGSYKSWLAQYIALHVAEGKSLFDRFDSQPGVVLIIDRENNYALIQERFKQLGAGSDLPIYFLDMEFSVENESQVELVRQEVENRKISLVIVDSLIRIHQQDENTSTGMAKVFSALRKLQDTGAAVLFTHHHRKRIGFARANATDDLRGSTDILAAVDSHLSVTTLEEGAVKVTQPKLRQTQAIAGFSLRFDGKVFEYLGKIEEEKAKTDLAKADILEVLAEGPIKQKELVEQLKSVGSYGRNSIMEALKYLKESSAIGAKSDDSKPLTKGKPQVLFLQEQNSSLQFTTHIDQTTKLPPLKDGKDQTTNQTTATNLNVKEGSLPQTTDQTTDDGRNLDTEETNQKDSELGKLKAWADKKYLEATNLTSSKVYLRWSQIKEKFESLPKDHSYNSVEMKKVVQDLLDRLGTLAREKDFVEVSKL